MNKEMILLAEKIGLTLKNDEDANKLINILQNKLKYYQEKNAHNEDWIKNLKVGPTNLSEKSQKTIENFVNIIEKSSVDSLEISDIGLALLDITEQKYYFTKKWEALNEKQNQLSKELNLIQQDVQNVREEIKLSKEKINRIDCISDCEISSLKELVKKYQDTVDQLMVKNPWIGEEQFSVLKIKEELSKLNSLRTENDKLQNDLEEYVGLKPNLESARQQLADIKSEYEIMYKEYTMLSK